jgi:hypothetical protein
LDDAATLLDDAATLLDDAATPFDDVVARPETFLNARKSISDRRNIFPNARKNTPDRRRMPQIVAMFSQPLAEKTDRSTKVSKKSHGGNATKERPDNETCLFASNRFILQLRDKRSHNSETFLFASIVSLPTPKQAES